MIRVNENKIDYEIASLSVMYDNSLNPTGLGSVGIYFTTKGLEVYIGVKKDVLDIITDINTKTFVNIPKEISENFNDSKWGSDDYEFDYDNSYRIHLDVLTIDIDIAALLKSVYTIDSGYKDLIKYKVFKDPKAYGAVLHYYSIYNIEQGMTNIGLLVTNSIEKWVFNKSIIDKYTLNDEFRYSVWFLKQNITPHVLSTHSDLKGYERLLIPEDKKHKEFEYINYFNDNHKANTSSTSSSQFSFSHSENHFNIINSHSTEDLDGDIFRVNGLTRGNGVKHLSNNTNFGLKEARKAYFDLRDGKTWTNIGYGDDKFIFGDNFYVDVRGYQSYPELSKIEPPKLRVELPNVEKYIELIGYSRLPDEFKRYQPSRIIGLLKSRIINSHMTDKSKIKLFVADTLCKKIKKDDDYEYIHSKIQENVYMSGSISYLAEDPSKIDDFSGKVIVVTNVFYDYAVYFHASSNNELHIDKNYNISFTLSNGYTFGMRDNQFIWKNITKEYREDKFYTVLDRDKVYTDLTKTMRERSGGNIDPKSWYNSINNKTGVYVVDTELLKDHMMTFGGISNGGYLFGNKFGYIKA